jgi:hypothetical protein
VQVNPGQLRPRRAFTLMEALMATSILFAAVVCVCSAVTSGQQHAYEAQQRIAAALAAEELVGRLGAIPYDELPSWNGHVEEVGQLVDFEGEPFPDSFAMVGRSVTVMTTSQALPDVGVVVRGRQVRVRAFDLADRTLTEVYRFIPEPQS